ncbi:MAG: FAD-dependent oxidoreductase [Pseudomonadales bacterium]|nr:FAD-dependent oxidoreductase [Pseudomonadales bacterium]MCP5319455.1 FAD-dependent oxidoreductase [Pseudomonadales bacterium]MCP5336994.1 FAD-dependent oxidoreductase [Pseudomonadales bacterium]
MDRIPIDKLKPKKRYDSLLAPGRIGSMQLRNRIVMTAMGSNLCNPDGTLNERIKAYYEARARGGAAMVIMGSVSISWPIGSANACQVAISDDRYIEGLADLARRIHGHGARIALQLQHAGVTAMNDVADGRPLLVPSVPKEGQSDIGPTLTEEEAGAMARPFMQPNSKLHYREATEEDLAWVCTQFADAVERAKKAGIDAVEIHAAHGYLISNFLSPSTNRRSDRYGGSLENRARLMVEVVQAVRARVGRDYPVWLRLDGVEFLKPEGITSPDAVAAARLAERAGVDAINVSAYADPDQGIGFTEAHATHIPGQFVPYAAAIRAAVNIPVITAGRIEPEVADRLIRTHRIDFVCMGRKLLADPELPRKLQEGRVAEIRPCIYCYTCISQIFVNAPVRCAVNAATSFETEVVLTPVERPRRVLVVGGGPAGMEVARVAALRGHRVTLCEKGGALGGSVRLSAISYPPNGRLVRYFENVLATLPVEIRLQTQVDEGFVRTHAPDVVVVATGARWQSLAIPGVDLPHVLDGESLRAMLGAGDGPLPKGVPVGLRAMLRLASRLGITRSPELLTQASRCWMPLGREVLIYGGGLVGIELAEFLSARGRKVTVLEEGALFAPQMRLLRRWRALHDCRARGVNLIANVREPRIESDQVSYLTPGGQRRAIAAQSVILAAGAAENTAFADALRAGGTDVRTVGDCAAIGYIEAAIRGGNALARSL